MLAILLLALTTAWLIANSNVAYAESFSTINVSVDHVVTFLDGGQVTINDTVKMTSNQSAVVSNFNVGFPYKYKFNLDYVFAYEFPNLENKLALDLNYGLGQTGFYAVRVNFGRDVNLTPEEPYSFSVVFVFSNLITARTQEVQPFLFDLHFPLYPSLAQQAVSSQTTVILPPNANFTSSSHPFNQTTSGVLTLPPKEPLDAFSLETGTITFTASDTFYLLEANEAKRNVVLDEWKELQVSDWYSLTNKAAQELNTLRVPLPQYAWSVSAQDELGNQLTFSLENGGAIASIALKIAVKQNGTANVQVTYRLPWKNHVDQNAWNNFNLKFRLFEPMNLTLRKLTVTITLPEGAEFQSSNAATNPNIVQSSAYQETPIFTLNNITSYQNLDFAITYSSHTVLWMAFRPTLWTGAIVLIIGALVFLWQTQRVSAPIPTGIPILPQELQSYVKAYDEERKILQERESLELQARKGKIPRRLYKVRSRTLESRLSVLSRDLANLREKIRAGGPRYAEMMRQIEVAETELQGVEADIRRTEIRYRRGEISAAAYHKLLEDSYKRRDRAKTNIDGVLLRLREEIS